MELTTKIHWFSPGNPVSSTNKTNRHVITEILLKVALNTITLTHNQHKYVIYFIVQSEIKEISSCL